MTHDDIIKAFQAEFADEIHDSDHYYQMYLAAADGNNEFLITGLFEMSKDEFTHAQFIHAILVRNSIPIPDDVNKKWHELQERAVHVYGCKSVEDYCCW